MPGEADSRFLPLIELAVRGWLGRSTIDTLNDTGHLPSDQLGGAIRVRLAEMRTSIPAERREAVVRPKAFHRNRRRVREERRSETVDGNIVLQL